MKTIREAIRKAVKESGPQHLPGEKEFLDADLELSPTLESLRKAALNVQKIYRNFFEVYYEYKFPEAGKKAIKSKADADKAKAALNSSVYEVRELFERMNYWFKKLPED